MLNKRVAIFFGNIEEETELRIFVEHFRLSIVKRYDTRQKASRNTFLNGIVTDVSNSMFNTLLVYDIQSISTKDKELHDFVKDLNLFQVNVISLMDNLDTTYKSDFNRIQKSFFEKKRTREKVKV